MLSQKDEPESMHGTAFMRHIAQIWNLRIFHSFEEIYLFDDDVKGAFGHSKQHPDIASAFSFIIAGLFCIPMGETFGSLVSPADFEPFARARTHLAKVLSTKREILGKYKEISDKVKFSEDPPEDRVL